MGHTARYAVAITGTGKETVEKALGHLFPFETADALIDGRRGTVVLEAPPLFCSKEVLAQLGDKAADLFERAEAYRAFAAPWFVYDDNVSVHEIEVTALAAEWMDFPAGSLALRMRTDRGEVVFLRDDVTIGHQSGNVFHHRPRLEPIVLVAVTVEEGSTGDAALTIAEYASFMIPEAGPIVAGLINVFHNWLKPPRKAGLANEQVVAEIGEMMKKLQVASDQAAVMGLYTNYISAMDNANDDEPETITAFAKVADETLAMNGSLVKANDDLTFNTSLFYVGVRAWSFTASFYLLALRHGMELDAQAKGLSIHKSDYWRRLRLAYHEQLTYLGNVIQVEKNGLRDRLAKIGTVREYKHTPHCELSPLGRPIPCPSSVLDGYGFEDDGKQAGMRTAHKSSHENELRAELEVERNGYVEKKRKEWLADFYKESDAVVIQIQETNAALLGSWYDSFENTILSAVKGWNPVKDPDYPVLKAWPYGPNKADPEGPDKMVIETIGGALWQPWEKFLDANSGEISSGYMKKENPVFRNVGNEGRLLLTVPHEKSKTYALRIRVAVYEPVRSFRIRWEEHVTVKDDARSHVVVPSTQHKDGKERTWVSRSVTVPIEGTGTSSRLVIEGIDGWTPDFATLEWFELEHFPKL